MRCADNNGCGSRAYFGLPSGRAIYCNAHKAANMVDVKRKYCAYDGCACFAAFGLPGGGRAIYCKMHKTADMVDVKHKQH